MNEHDMTGNDAMKILQATLACMKRENSVLAENECSGDCDECEYNYAQGTVGEHEDALSLAIDALEKQTVLKPQAVLLDNGEMGYECQNCGNGLSTKEFESVYCHWCGQKLKEAE